MYEDVTVEDLFNQMMARIPDTMDKRESSLPYLVLMPVAVEMKQLLLDLDYVLDNSFADTADRAHLIQIAKEMSLAPNTATPTKVTGKFNISVDKGQRFTTGKYIFFITGLAEKAGDGFYYVAMESEQSGALNDEDYLNQSIVPITLQGAAMQIKDLTTAMIVSIDERGENEEDTEAFRNRYFQAMKWNSYGGNIADYKEMLSTLPGVGGVKVVPVWNGGGTVKLVITDSSNKIPSADFVKNVQEKIDPPGYEGQGMGLAPIDHKVTVEAAEALDINVSFDIQLADGQTWESVKPAVTSAIEDYIAKQREGWEDVQGLPIRIAYIEGAVLDLPTVVDVQNTRLNGADKNVICGEYQLPVLGTITGTVIK